MRNLPFEIEKLIEKTDSCWLWHGPRCKDGYGHLYILEKSSRQRQAHTVVYEFLIGPVPKGLELDHTCKNPSCVNPAHLEPVTHTTNIRRSKHTKLTEKLVIEIKEAIKSGCSQELIALRFRIAQSTVSKIKTGFLWKT